MTHIEIGAMQAGRELDALVAEKVMGWGGVREGYSEGSAELRFIGKPPNGMDSKYPVPMYSTDIAAAWEVLEKIKAVNLEKFTGLDFPDECFVVAWDRSSKDWEAGFHSIDGYDAGWVSDCRSNAATAPLAICRAARKAVTT